MMKAIMNDKGITLVEVIVMTIIVSIAMVGLHISILYAETQMVRNYHERKAYLLASGQLELCQQRMNNQNRDNSVRYLWGSATTTGTQTWIDSEVYIVNNGENRIIPTVTVKYSVGSPVDVVNNTNLQYIKVEANVTWTDPTYKVGTAERTKTIKMREDFYSFHKPSAGGGQ